MKKHLFNRLHYWLMGGLVFCASAVATPYSETPQGRNFINAMNGQWGYSEAELTAIFSQIERDESILRKISRPAEQTTPWYRYRQIFLDKQRIANGVLFYKTHRRVLEEAFEKYGVSPYIITAIIGVETRYGKVMGKDRVITALATIGFDYPQRSEFFTKELRAFLQMSAEEGFNPFDVYGSYAGAMGMAQFMPSSYLNYAVDYDGDGRRDLWTNPNDAIFSVANYLAAHGWQRYGEIVDQAKQQKPYQGKISHQPFTTFDALKADGIVPTNAEAFSGDTLVGYLELEGSNSTTLTFVTFNNFSVITTYNTSPLYAMAVASLAQAIEAAQ